MSGVAIYMEGGGTAQGEQWIRDGMNSFLRSVKDRARRKRLRWKVVLCGSRAETIKSYRREIRRATPDEKCLLLVDSDGAVEGSCHDHLFDPEEWRGIGADADAVHLMVRVMETWIVADLDALASFYGHGFDRGKLPRRVNLEDEPKEAIISALESATRRTGKGRYRKISHAAKILQLMDADVVRDRCRHCDRLFVELDRLVADA